MSNWISKVVCSLPRRPVMPLSVALSITEPLASVELTQTNCVAPLVVASVLAVSKTKYA